MLLRLYPNVRASGVLPDTWLPNQRRYDQVSGNNRAVLRELRRLRGGRWKRVIRVGTTGEVHFFEHQSGVVAGVKFLPKLEER